MAVVFDPHQKEPGNLIPDEAVTVVGTKYRMLQPLHGPYYTNSLIVKSAGVPLKYGRDYVFTHPYLTGIQRTGRNIHGQVWLVNDKYKTGFTVTYHAVGTGEATAAQLAAEAAANVNKYPSARQWEMVVGEVYFPPVDIQFDWVNWKGELDLMKSIVAIGTKLTTVPPIPDPIVNNTYEFVQYEQSYKGNVTYKNDGSWDVNRKLSTPFYVIQGNSNRLRDYSLRMTFNLKSQFNSLADPGFSLSLRNYWVDGFANIKLTYQNGQLVTSLYSSPSGGTETNTAYATATVGGRTLFSKPFKVTVTNSYTKDTLRVKVEQDGAVILDSLLDFANPPPVLAAIWAADGIASRLSKRTTDIRYWWYGDKGDTFSMQEVPGANVETPDGADVLTLLKQYHAIVDALYRDAPAHAHVLDNNNPHIDTYGPIGALEKNGIASDATLVYGKNQAQLADYVNLNLPKVADLANKLPRIGVNTPFAGTFVMKPGLASVTATSQANENAGVESLITVDDKFTRLISKGNISVSSTGQATLQSGTNQLVLYPDSRGLLWKGKILLDPTTVGPYLPGNSGGGDGLFYGQASLTVNINGNGIQTLPFSCVWLKPDASVLSTPALRLLTNDFGNSDSLMATPALVSKLDALYVGKLLLTKANINGLSLASSVTIDKITFGLDAVDNIADVNLVVSTAQQLELNKYSPVDHTHPAEFFGIGPATPTVLGTVQFGDAVDDPALMLDGGVVVGFVDRVSKLSENAGNVDSAAVIDIIRYGVPGNASIASGITATGWMVSVKANTYFVRQQYAVPLLAANLTELFPGAYTNRTFYVYVDVVNNAGVYSISATDRAESDTLTKIGSFTTNTTGVTDSEVHSVTRLGDFRELVDHIASVNDHSKRSPTQAQFGTTYQAYGAEFGGGVAGVTRNDADWRPRGINGWKKNLFSKWDSNKFTFQPTGVAVTDHLLMQCLTAHYGMTGTALTFLPRQVSGGDDTLIELMLLGYSDDAGNFNRFSVLMTKSNYISNDNGGLSCLGFAVNYGSPKQIIIGATDKPVDPVMGWTGYGMGCSYRASTNAVGATVLMNGYINVTFDMANLKLTMGTQSNINLKDRLTAAGVDVTRITDPTLKRYYGVGGSFDGVFTIQVSTPTNFNDDKVYTTLPSFVDTFSGVNRARLLEGFLTKAQLAMTDDQLRKDIASSYSDTFYDGTPMFISPAELLLYSDRTNKRYTAVVIRD